MALTSPLMMYLALDNLDGCPLPRPFEPKDGGPKRPALDMLKKLTGNGFE